MRRLLSPVIAVALALAVAVPAAAQTPTTTAPAATAPAPATSAPAQTTATTSTQAASPAPMPADDPGGAAPLLVGLAVLLGLAALTVLLWGIARLTAWEPSWLPATRHSLGEAAYRAGATWGEFRDWLRPPRRR